MNVSRINSKPFQHAVLIFQPVNRISYFLSAFSFLYWTATLLSFQKAIVHKIYRQTIEQGHQTGTGLLSHFSPLLNPTQAIYGTFILFQSLNAYPLCSCVIGFKSQHRTNAIPIFFHHAIHQPEPCRTQRFFLIFLLQPPWNKKDFKPFSYKGFFNPGKIPRFRPIFSKKSP